MGEGKVWLVGAGPGDPSLLTLRGLDLLRQADDVVYDRLVSPALLDHAPSANHHYVGKQRGRHAARQDQINELLIDLARQGRRVVRLKGGDPFVFGRGGEEALALRKAGIEWEVVPGISAAVAAPAYAGIPVTHRGLAASFAIVTGHEGLAAHTGALTDTLVVLMATQELAETVGTLLDRGWNEETPAALIEAASTSRQRTVHARLDTLVEAARAAAISPPATLVVGPTVALARDLAWFDNRPLFGRRVVIARTRPGSSLTARLFTAAGAEVLELPGSEVVPPDPDVASQSISRLRGLAANGAGWMVFRSSEIVAATWERLAEAGLDSRALRVRVAAFGSDTVQALAAHGVRADWSVQTRSSKEIAAGLVERGAAEASVLVPCLECPDLLLEELRARGVGADALPVGTLQVDERRTRAAMERVAVSPGPDLLVFPASRAVDMLLDAFASYAPGFDASRSRVLCIGAQTADRARQRGLAVSSIASDASRESLLEAAIRLLPSYTRASAQ